MLEKLLKSSSWRPHVLRLLGSDGISAAMRACLSSLAAHTSTIACMLLENSSAARRAMQVALDEGALVHVSTTTPAKQPKKKDRKVQKSNLATIAALLPPLNMFIALEAKSTKKALDKDKASSFSPGLQQISTHIVDELLSWLSTRAVERDGSIGDEEESNSTADKDTADLLHTWGIRCLTQALPLAQPSQDNILAVLAALSTEKESQWNLAADALAVDSTAPTSVEKAAAVDALLQYLLQYNPTTTEGTAKITTASSSWLTAELLAPIARTFFHTVSTSFKIKAPVPAQQSAERAFLRLLDASLSEAVALLPDSERKTSAFTSLTTEACTEFGTAVLRRKAGDPLAMRVLRRFTAALLPSGTGSSEDDAEMTNSAVSSTAGELFQLALSHSHFISTMRDSSASPLPLPAAAAALPLPLQSLLPAVDVPTGDNQDPSAENPLKRKEESMVLPSSREFLPRVKAELCMLLETLLDVEEIYRATSNAVFKSRGSGYNSGNNEELIKAETALLPVVMAAYGGSLSAADVAVWDLARALNARAWRRRTGSSHIVDVMELDESGEESEEEEESGGFKEDFKALLKGPLADTW